MSWLREQCTDFHPLGFLVTAFLVRLRVSDQEGEPVSTPEPTDYPESWKPKHVRERDAARAEFEKHVAALSDEELKRIRKAND